MPNRQSGARQAAAGGARTNDVDAEEAPPGDVARADFLARAALTFVAKVYPIADVQVSYRRRGPDHPSDVEPGDASDAPCWDVQPVPGRPEVLRVLRITLNEEVSRFLSRDEEEASLADACARIALTVGKADAWANHLGAPNDQDTRDVLTSALPTRLVARLAAAYLREERTGSTFADAGDDEVEELARTLAGSLEYMDDLARSRVEHEELSHGVIVAPPGEGDRAGSAARRYPRDFRPFKRTPLLSDGYQAALRVSPGGQPLELLMRPDFSAGESEPPAHEFGEFTFLAAASRKYGGIGLMLRPGGSIVVFAKGRPLFIRRSGQWRGMIWNVIRDVMVERYGTVGTQVFDAALLLTTSGRGGILAVMDEGPPADLNEKDRVDRAHEAASPPGDEAAEPGEWLFHDLLPEDGVTAMRPPSLALLASIDGATLVARDGTLLAYGAIVPSHQSESEGARTAAARTLSSGGLVLKISEDGPIQLFENEEHMLTI